MKNILSEEYLNQMYQRNGKTIPEIAEITGNTPDKVYYWLRRYGIPRRRRGINWIGRKHTDEAKKKISEAKKGKPLSDIWKKSASFHRLGKKKTTEHRKNIGEAIRGEKHYNWKGGLNLTSAQRREIQAGRPKPDNCEICGTFYGDNKKMIAFDHNHVTGEFRGWICVPCNSSIGMAKENIDTIEKIVEYLKKNEKRSIV